MVAIYNQFVLHASNMFCVSELKYNTADDKPPPQKMQNNGNRTRGSILILVAMEYTRLNELLVNLQF